MQKGINSQKNIVLILFILSCEQFDVVQAVADLQFPLIPDVNREKITLSEILKIIRHSTSR